MAIPFRHRARGVAFGAVFLLMTSISYADPIPLNVVGIVEHTVGPLPMAIGDTVSISLALDPTLLVSSISAHHAEFSGRSLSTVVFRREGVEVLRFDLNGVAVTINNDLPSFGHPIDTIGINVFENTFRPGRFLVGFGLTDPSARALSSLDVPAGLNLDAFTERSLSGGFGLVCCPSENRDFAGTVTSIVNGGDVPTAPEPASIILFGTGLAAAGMRYRRKPKSL